MHGNGLPQALFHMVDNVHPKFYRGLPEGIIASRMKGMALKNPNYSEEPSFRYAVFVNGKGGVGRTCGHKTTRGWQKG